MTRLIVVCGFDGNPCDKCLGTKENPEKTCPWHPDWKCDVEIKPNV